ncbi:HNH endonuclease [Halomonas sp. H33-56]|uniref:HNH endonuclease n=1 Tax=Halomonas sp. H33-56 TaxID=2950873 RepID=UPI0032E0010E
MSTYCIYTDREYPHKELTREHIIPLSLGGVNGFEILVEKEINKFFGSKVDGKLANDFLIKLDRKNADARGHSNKPVQPVWNKVSVKETGEPLQIKFEKPGDTKWISAISKKEIDKTSLNKKEISISLSVDTTISFQFTAKVALAAGYFIYGDMFKDQADTTSLRKFSTARTLNKDNKFGNRAVSTYKRNTIGVPEIRALTSGEPPRIPPEASWRSTSL